MSRNPMETLDGKKALVMGGSRGLGRGMVEALHGAGASVHAVARHGSTLASLQSALGAGLSISVADAADAVIAGQLLDALHADVLVLNAGAAPLSRPRHYHTWESFSRNWDVDVKIGFHWLREALLLPLAPGSTVVVVSSGAALQGSALSGGYAGAKATLRFIARYAAEDAGRQDLGIRIAGLFRQLTPTTDLSRHAMAAYARRAGLTEEAFIAQRGAPLTPQTAGDAVAELLTDTTLAAQSEYLLSSAGLQVLDRGQ